MNTDFLDAHDRHWQDAELLFKASRWANADHLYGLAAECGLKQLMIAFGMLVDPTTGTPQIKKDRAHVMEQRKTSVWDRYGAYCSGYDAHYVLSSTNPFADWDIAQRYAHQCHFDQDRVAVHKNGANSVCSLIKTARLDGRL